MARECGAQKVGCEKWGEKSVEREKWNGGKWDEKSVATNVGHEKWGKKSGARNVGREKCSEKSGAEESGTRKVG